jgi:hypothetical protein
MYDLAQVDAQRMEDKATTIQNNDGMGKRIK